MMIMTLKHMAPLMRADSHLNQRPVCASAQTGLLSRTPKRASVTDRSGNLLRKNQTPEKM
jgi:hypothetical protein